MNWKPIFGILAVVGAVGFWGYRMYSGDTFRNKGRISSRETIEEIGVGEEYYYAVDLRKDWKLSYEFSAGQTQETFIYVIDKKGFDEMPLLWEQVAQGELEEMPDLDYLHSQVVSGNARLDRMEVPATGEYVIAIENLGDLPIKRAEMEVVIRRGIW